MGFFDKLREGLKKTKDSFVSKVNTLVNSFTKIDEDFFEELEECLILADTGMETTEKAISDLRHAIDTKKLRSGGEVKAEFVQILSKLVKVQDTALLLTTQPSVVLMVGVNGVGKTTTIGKLACQLDSEGYNVRRGYLPCRRLGSAHRLGQACRRGDRQARRGL